MSFELLDRLSLPGDPAKPNEDSFAFLDHAALLLDGATPLGPPLLPGKSDALWIAQFGARRLAAHLKDGDPPLEALRHALADAEKSFAGLSRGPIREKWQTPCAALMMVAPLCLPRDKPSEDISPRQRLRRAGGESRGQASTELEFLWFGDCCALIAQEGHVEIVGEALKARSEERDRAERLARKKNLGSALGVDRPEIEPLLRAGRNRINSGRNWLFSPDVRAADHVARRTIQAGAGAELLLASDGFLALVSDYGAYDAASLMNAVRHQGLAALGGELRAVEAADPEGKKFPRFKKSDDATALYFRLRLA